MITTIRDHINALIDKHGGVRAAARAVGIDAGYLVKLRDGEKAQPGASVLEKLKLVRVTTYVSKA